MTLKHLRWSSFWIRAMHSLRIVGRSETRTLLSRNVPLTHGQQMKWGRAVHRLFKLGTHYPCPRAVDTGIEPTSSSLRITDRSFRYASPCLWNQLPSSLRQPHFSPSVSALPVHAPTTSSHSVNSPLSPSITPSFTPGSRPTSFTNLSHHRLPSSLRTDSTDRFFWAYPFYICFSFFIILFCLVPCGRLSWLLVSFWAHVNIVHRIVSYRWKMTPVSTARYVYNRLTARQNGPWTRMSFWTPVLTGRVGNP